MHTQKTALGTAQFGMDYGINNKRGKIPINEAFEILKTAAKYDINTLDTAYSYGESESVIGEFIKNNRSDFKIISKLPKCDISNLNDKFNSSLRKLNVDSLYGYLIHDFKNYVEQPKTWTALKNLKAKLKVNKIGFSFYFPTDLKQILDSKITFDIIQIPYSIFDQRFAPYLPALKSKGVEIHIRSVFLQGLVFMNPDEVDAQFIKIKSKIKKINLISADLGIPLSALYFNFAALNEHIDAIIIGVDSIVNLQELLLAPKHVAEVAGILEQLRDFKENDETIILPVNWKLSNT